MLLPMLDNIVAMLGNIVTTLGGKMIIVGTLFDGFGVV